MSIELDRFPVAVLLAALWGCAVSSVPAGCPEGTVALSAERGRIESALGAAPSGGALLAALRARHVGVCFGEAPPLGVLWSDRAVVLDRALPVAENAARLAHLAVHVRDGAPYPAATPAGADCDRLVHIALEREADAHAVEIELRRELGVDAPQLILPFEPDYRRTGDPAVILSWLLAHPGGGGGVDALGAGYRERCEREARQTGGR